MRAAGLKGPTPRGRASWQKEAGGRRQEAKGSTTSATIFVKQTLVFLIYISKYVEGGKRKNILYNPKNFKYIGPKTSKFRN